MNKREIQKIRKIFSKNNLLLNRLISGSKSSYTEQYPDNFILFNAKIYDKKTFEKEKDKQFFENQENELWYGDLDLNKDIYNLSKVAYMIEKSFVVTTENGTKQIEVYYLYEK